MLGIEDRLAVLVNLNGRVAVQFGVFLATFVQLRLIAVGFSRSDLHDFGAGDIPGAGEFQLLLCGVLQELLDKLGIDESAFAFVGAGAADGDNESARGIGCASAALVGNVAFESAVFLTGIGVEGAGSFFLAAAA